MKQLIFGLILGIAISGICVASGVLKCETFSVVLSPKNFITTTKVTTEEGTYRIFTIESSNPKNPGVGISAIKIK